MSDRLKDYVDGRYADLLDYYDRRAITAKRGHTFCSLYLVIISVVIAPIQVLSLRAGGSDIGEIIVAILSPTLAIVAGIAAHFKFHENWLSYRITWDSMKRELSLLNAGAGRYRDCPDSTALFVEQIEALAASEAKEFYSRHASRSSKAESGDSLKPR